MDMLRRRWYAGNAAAVRGGSAPVQTNIAAWFRYGQGITVTGAGVSQWSDASGNSRHLLQGTDANRPALNGSAILFDGVDKYLATAAFTYLQPLTLYLLFKQVTHTSNDHISDGVAPGKGAIYQAAASPNINIYAGAAVGPLTTFTIDTYGVLTVVFDDAASVIQRNLDAPVLVSAGVDGMGGLTLGCSNAFGGHSNIEVKEAILYSGAHDAPTRAQVIAYLASVGGLSI